MISAYVGEFSINETEGRGVIFLQSLHPLESNRPGMEEGYLKADNHRNREEWVLVKQFGVKYKF